jgi:hypothetical protein
MDILTTLLIASFFFIMGAAVIGLIWYLMGVSSRMKGTSKNSTPADPNLSELVCLMRHLQTDELVVKMDGITFNAAQEVSPTQQRRLSFISNVFTQWLTQITPEQQSTKGPATELSTPVEEHAIEEFLSITAEPTPTEPQPGYTPAFAAEPMQEIKPVSTSLPDMVGDLLNPTLKPEPEFKSIAVQINDILQAQIAGTTLEPRHIMLSDAPDHGVRVTLDGKQYEGVMDVPDEDVRRAIRTAVLEWETKK